MHLRQTLDLQTSRFVSHKHPVPIGTLARGLLDQFLIDQPWLNSSEVSNSRVRNIFDLIGGAQTTGADPGPVIEIHCLLEQMRPFQTACGFGHELAAGIEDQISSLDRSFMKRANESGISRMIHCVRVVFV
jgi:hypothetical protein